MGGTGNRRVEKGIARGRQFEIEVDGRKIIAYEGETVGTALVAAGVQTFRHTAKRNQPRGMYCGIGLCYDCAMVINGIPNTRACQTLATPGCRVQTQEGLGRLEDDR
jgi:predicted molibdopterin-dependent oxidoreductase YjgC